MFRRKVYDSLQRWATRRGQTALLVTGARQIGKSYLVERLGREKYQRLLTVNLYLDKAAKRSLAEASNVADLITRLSLMADQISPRSCVFPLFPVPSFPVVFNFPNGPEAPAVQDTLPSSAPCVSGILPYTVLGFPSHY